MKITKFGKIVFEDGVPVLEHFEIDAEYKNDPFKCAALAMRECADLLIKEAERGEEISGFLALDFRETFNDSDADRVRDENTQFPHDLIDREKN